MRRFARFGTISQFIKREKHPWRSVIASKGKVAGRNFEKWLGERYRKKGVIRAAEFPELNFEIGEDATIQTSYSD